VASAAAGAGSIEVLEWLQQHGCSAPAQSLATAAVRTGALTVLQWVDQHQQQHHQQEQQQQQQDELPMVPHDDEEQGLAPWERGHDPEELQPAYWYDAHFLCLDAIMRCPLPIETLRWLHEHGDPATSAHRVQVMASVITLPTAEVLSYLTQLGHVFDKDRLRGELSVPALR
jgi:hypothetical protein